MQFARVTATLSAETSSTTVHPGNGHLLVIVDTGTRVETVRDDSVPLLEPTESGDPLAWNADQYLQETIAVDLALEGWEVIGMADELVETFGIAGRATAPTYLIRRSSPPPHTAVRDDVPIDSGAP